MNRKSARDVSLPDYMEIGTEEIYQDPGSTLPQGLHLPAAPRVQDDNGDTLPPELSEAPHANDVRTGRPVVQPAIVAGQGVRGRLPHDGPMPKRVLVVDDDLTARLYIRARLMLRGNVQIFEASSVPEGLALLQSQPAIEAALLDVDMGEQSGYELCRAIRQWIRRQGGTQPTIYMITSRRSVVDQLRAKMAGADAFVSKPPSPKQLAELLAQL